MIQIAEDAENPINRVGKKEFIATFASGQKKLRSVWAGKI